jgi:hypothetical protein
MEVCFPLPANDKRYSTFAETANVPIYNQQQCSYQSNTHVGHSGHFCPNLDYMTTKGQRLHNSAMDMAMMITTSTFKLKGRVLWTRSTTTRQTCITTGVSDPDLFYADPDPT